MWKNSLKIKINTLIKEFKWVYLVLLTHSTVSETIICCCQVNCLTSLLFMLHSAFLLHLTKQPKLKQTYLEWIFQDVSAVRLSGGHMRSCMNCMRT